MTRRLNLPADKELKARRHDKLSFYLDDITKQDEELMDNYLYGLPYSKEEKAKKAYLIDNLNNIIDLVQVLTEVFHSPDVDTAKESIRNVMHFHVLKDLDQLKQELIAL